MFCDVLIISIFFLRSRGEDVSGVGFVRDKDLKVEDDEVSHTLD